MTRRGGSVTFVLVLGGIYTVNFIDRTIVSVLGEAIRRDLGLSDLQLGLLGGLAFSFFYGAVGIPLARLAERVNRVRLIAVVTTLWSVMTMLCGVAGSFVHLLLCRMGVGIGEAGFTPALVSMISDRFAADRRGAVFSIVAAGVPLGGALAAIAGGLVGAALGWRLAFVAVGVPGLVLAAVLLATVKDAERRSVAADIVPPMRETLRHLAGSRAFVLLTTASGLVSLVGFGLNLFLIPLLVRRFGMDLREAGLSFALAFSLATGAGGIAGGMAMGRLIRRDRRWGGWAPAALLACGVPFYLAALVQDDWRAALALLFPATLSLYAFLPAVMTVTQSLVEPRMRATAAAIHSFGQTVVGLGFGSVLLGYLSDRLASATFAGDYRAICLLGKARSAACLHASAWGLQHALMLLAVFLVLAVGTFALAGMNLTRETRSA